MGEIRYQGEKYFNYLLKDEKASRISRLSSALKKSEILKCNCKVYLFGSYLRQKIFNDIDIILVYPDKNTMSGIELIKNEINKSFQGSEIKIDFTICSENEFSKMELIYDNREQIL
ncbi:nucleotidyltransferase domain-containing protein [Okeania sp. SIO2B3]|uniref:nucleotidyltransferase domain-containing protein n=1 Tax=Okeania sp. SIO2B3 TaxID=2607784 RepID=UPI0013C24969|nr:nucleotidyltransferase domain-containing protein [Okeania sp. SIO2B3]NET43261.1 nucleotidyltransferase domain-containing protein [Okeania sp. SIO2B3]